VTVGRRSNRPYECPEDQSSIARASPVQARQKRKVAWGDRHVKRRRPTKGDVDPVRLLALYDLAHKLGRHGQEVDAVSEPFRRCDRRDVWVDENGVDALFERFDRLRD